MPRLVQPSPTDRLRPLDARASAPLWRQLKQALRDLAVFHLRPGDRIPSEAELCQHYGLSRVTVRQAITSLVSSGILHRQHGRGTYVLPGRTSAPLGDAEHFLVSSFELAARARLRVYSAERVGADERIADKLGGAVGEDVHKVRILLLEGEEPGAYRVSWVLARRAPDLLAEDLTRPLHRLLEDRYGWRLGRAEEAVECIAADAFRAELLLVPASHPLMAVEWLVSLDDGQPILFSRAYYRADRYVLRRHLAPIRTSAGRTLPVATLPAGGLRSAPLVESASSRPSPGRQERREVEVPA